MTRPRASRPSCSLGLAELTMTTSTLMGPWRVLNAALTSAGLRDLRRDLSALSEEFEPWPAISGTEPKALRTCFACTCSTERPNLRR